jgi:type VI secretion system protein ImpL
MTSMGWLWIALSVFAALVLAAVVWLGGPLVYFGETQPFDGVLSRLLIIVIIFAIVTATIAWRIVTRRRATAAIEKAMTEAPPQESDAPILKQRMDEALATLRRTGTSSARTLYDLPWYLIIGPPGAGKTTALVNSGLKFPLAGHQAAKAIQGVGGTRYCDWWFTDAAVLIDTAGRYTTQDSDARADRRSWLAFLDLLRTNRPRQPINGVVVAISIADVLNLPRAEVNAHADAIRRRLAELRQQLRVDFPVYAIFTKMDLIVGFTQYFADLDETRRQVVWGATFETAQRRANNVGKAIGEMDLLIERVSERMTERLQSEPDLRSRVILFGFPAQLGALRKPIADFLNRIVEATRHEPIAALRGFYFTSGTQEGTPFDALIGTLQKSYGVETVGSAGFSSVGKSYFLHDLLKKVIFGEAGWVSTNAVRRSAKLRAAASAVIALVTIAIISLWRISYAQNETLIAETAQGVSAYSDKARDFIKLTSVNDTKLDDVYQLVSALPHLPVGYARRNDPTPIDQTFGLSQRARLSEASDRLYQQALERLMRPRLILSLEQQIQKNIDDPAFVYEALKIYLMLGGKAEDIDKNLIVSWFSRDWEERAFPGAQNAAGRDILRSHLAAMLDMDTGQASKTWLNGQLVQQAQATLARMRVAQRAYILLKSEPHGEPIEDWIASRYGGPDVALVFEAANGANLDTVRVPGFFTYAGFSAALLSRMQTIAEKLQKESWVLGASGDQSAIKQQYASLFPDILDLYGRDFIAAWTAAINNLQLRPLLNDKPKYLNLRAASAPTSPILSILQSIRDETTLTREPPAQDVEAAQAKPEKSQRRPGDPPAQIPGASIEAHFKPFKMLVDGQPGSRPIDSLLANLNELYGQLVFAAENPQAKQALDQIEVQVASLRANASRLPEPFAGMIDKVAHDAASDANASSIAQIADSMSQDVTGTCQQIVSNRYPFAKGDREVSLVDFSRLFAPGGVIDKFFGANIEPLVSRSGKTWAWKPNPNLSRKLSDATLRQFQAAAEIRDAFFPTGGSSPNLSFAVKPVTLSSDAQTATLSINGVNMVAQQETPAVSSTVPWPGAGAGSASITMAPDMPDRPSKLERTGAWALFRLVDVGSPIQNGSTLKVSFVVFGREVSYEFTSNSVINPLTMPSLRQFKCPNGL